MRIHEMSRDECFRMLTGLRLARLACARENQPYIVPVYLACDGPSQGLYGFTTPGRKVEWMRLNPRVCVEVDEIVADDQWQSVIGIGSYEELSASAAGDDRSLRSEERPADSRYRPRVEDEVREDERLRAWQVLKNLRSVWWEPASTAWAARVHRDPAEPFTPIYFRIRLDHVTGHRATRDAADAVPPPATPVPRWDRVRGTLMRLFGAP